MTPTLRLYDLAGKDPDRRFSPYCWRIRLALAHKGLPVETIPWRFTEKAEISPSGQGKVPVLVHGERWIHESWAIACYLEDAFPQGPSLFGGESGRALSRHYSDLADGLNAVIIRFVLADIFAQLDPGDQAYFRKTREQRFGMSLEQVVADREARVDGFRASLSPMRATLAVQPFFGGNHPLYADYALFSSFQWARCVSSFALLEASDPLWAWRERLLDAFDGLARSVPAAE